MLIKPIENTFLPISCELPASLAEWLAYPDSLTERLQDKAGHAKLQVLRQQWERANWWDKQVFHVLEGQVMHREIVMYANDEPCWYARTIIPEATYQAGSSFFNRLQKESLGTLIFNETKIKRLSMVHYPISEQSIEYHWLKQWLSCSALILWVRMSVFSFNNDSPFFLIETLLPALERYSN